MFIELEYDDHDRSIRSGCINPRAQLISGGVARKGVAAATTLLMRTVPIAVFVINQSKIVETMGTSGMSN